MYLLHSTGLVNCSLPLTKLSWLRFGLNSLALQSMIEEECVSNLLSLCICHLDFPHHKALNLGPGKGGSKMLVHLSPLPAILAEKRGEYKTLSIQPS